MANGPAIDLPDGEREGQPAGCGSLLGPAPHRENILGHMKPHMQAALETLKIMLPLVVFVKSSVMHK